MTSILDHPPGPTPRPTPAPEPLLVDAVEAAKLLSISPRLLWSLTQAGEVPTVRLGRRVLYSPEGLRRWVNQRQTAAAADNSGEVDTQATIG